MFILCILLYQAMKFVIMTMTLLLVGVSTAMADHPEVTIEPVQGSWQISHPCADANSGVECYNPAVATVDVGGTVIFANTDTAGHAFLSGKISDEVTGLLFDSSLIQPGQSFEWSPDKEGRFDHFCNVHPWMNGVIVVQKAHGDETPSNTGEGITGMMTNSEIVKLNVDPVKAGEQLTITVEFLNQEHVNYDIKVTQKGNIVLDEKDIYVHEGSNNVVTKTLDFDVEKEPVDISIEFQGYGITDERTGPIGEKIEFTEVIPEFPYIALILSVAVIGLVVTRFTNVMKPLQTP